MQGRCDCWRRCWSVWHVVKSTQSIATRRRRLPWLPCMETPSRANHWWVNPVPRRNCTQSISSNCSTQYYIVDCKGSFNNYVTPFCSIFGPPPPVTTCHTLRPVYSDTTQTSSWVASAGRYRHFADATQLNSTSYFEFFCIFCGKSVSHYQCSGLPGMTHPRRGLLFVITMCYLLQPTYQYSLTHWLLTNWNGTSDVLIVRSSKFC